MKVIQCLACGVEFKTSSPNSFLCVYRECERERRRINYRRNGTTEKTRERARERARQYYDEHKAAIEVFRQLIGPCHWGDRFIARKILSQLGEQSHDNATS